MTQTQTIVKAADNTGAKTAKRIKILAPRSYASIGDCILVSIRSVRRSGNIIKKGQIYKALVIRTKKGTRKNTYAFSYTFDDNEVVLINDQGNLIGSRIFGSITQDLRACGRRGVASQSKKMLY